MFGLKMEWKKLFLLGTALLLLALLLPMLLGVRGSTMAEGTALVVIDAGHGGFDPGAIGVTGVHEDDLNLAIAGFLKEELESRGVMVLMTREDEKALTGTKTSDMYKRRDIIAQSNAHAAISIHMNSNKDATARGPVAIHYRGSEGGQKLAALIQEQMNVQLKPTRKRSAYGESYFILKSGKSPVVIVECGFISNRDEEWALRQEDYQRLVASSIADGICLYLFGDGETPAA